MPKQPNTKLIGIFLIIGFFSFLIAIGIPLHKKISDENIRTVMYFDESIKGLNVGSPVIFKGVQVGQVAKIDLVTDYSNLYFYIPVYVDFYKGKIFTNKNNNDNKILVNKLIEKGLRARLTTQSFITGQSLIELEMVPQTKCVLRDNTKNPILEIPTVASSITRFSKKLERLQLDQLINKVSQLLDTLDRELFVLLPNASNACISVNHFFTKLDENLFLLTPNISKTLNNIDAFTTCLKPTLHMLDSISSTANSIKEAAKSFKNLSDLLERHPESLLQGKNGDRR